MIPHSPEAAKRCDGHLHGSATLWPDGSPIVYPEMSPMPVYPAHFRCHSMHQGYQWRIQDFPQGGAPTPKIAIIFHIFAENCMKMKEFGPPGGGRASLAPPLGSANGYFSPVAFVPNLQNPEEFWTQHGPSQCVPQSQTSSTESESQLVIMFYTNKSA